MNLRQLAVAGVNGVASTAVDMATLVLLVSVVGLPVAPAAFAGCCMGAVTNYLLNKYVAFRDHSRITWWQLARFSFVAVGAGLLTAGLMQIGAVRFGIPVPIAKAICAAIVFAAWTYPAQRKLVFHRRPAFASA